MRIIYRLDHPLDLARVLGPLSRGPYDPCLRREKIGTYWRASRTPLGPSTTRFTQTPEGIEIESFGDGAEWAIANAPDLLGASDDASGFAPKGKLADIQHRHPGLRIGRSNAVFEAALRSVCEQLVTGREAQRSYDRMARKYGEKAPGPFDLLLPPAPEVVAKLAYYDLRPMGLEMKRANTLRAVARSAKAIEATLTMSLPDAYKRLLLIPGVGPWTAAEVALVALGDADAVSVGDYHLKNLVSFAFTGEARGTDERMLELLEPYRPHRARVIKLIYVAGIRAPRFGPKKAIRNF